jgi:hypothetical protein
MGFGKEASHFVVGRFVRFAGLKLGLVWELLPAKLIVQIERDLHDTPVVDRSGGTRRNAIQAEIAFLGIHHVVVVIVGDGADRAGFLAGVAPDADFRIDHMLSVTRACRALDPGCRFAHALPRLQ